MLEQLRVMLEQLKDVQKSTFKMGKITERGKNSNRKRYENQLKEMRTATGEVPESTERNAKSN
jgi:uncharacterized protein YktB (UPF0637 family)